MITLKTLPQATAQEVFDQAAKHLIAQGERSTEHDGTACLYLSPDGLKCAAGCFIGDDEYTGEYEANDWAILIDEEVAPQIHDALIINLQSIHDRHQPCEWPSLLQELAESLGLNSQVITN